VEFKDYIGHVLTLASMLTGGAVVVIRWLLASRDKRIDDLEKELGDYKRTCEGAIASAVTRSEATIAAAAAAAKADYIERMGNVAKDCGKDLAMGVQRLETLYVTHVEKASVDIGTLKRQLEEVRQDLRSAQRVLGRYEVLNGRTDE
jgi:hypothetical protein